MALPPDVLNLPEVPAAGSRRAGGWTPAAIAVGAFLALPIVIVLAHLLVPGGDAWAHLSATVLPGYVATTLTLLAFVLAGVLVVGVSSAWLVAACEFPGRRVLEWALLMPLAMPAYVIAFAYTDLLQYSGPLQAWLRSTLAPGASPAWMPEIRSLGGAATIFVFVLYPYVYLLARVAFRQQSPSLADAGRTLGLSPWSSFLRVSLPMARPAIAAGAALALMETLADYGAVSYFGVQTFTTGIFRAWLSLGEPVAAAKLAVMLLAFVSVVLVAERMARRRARFADLHGSARRPRVRLRGPRALAAFLACALPSLIGFIIPAFLLVRLSLGDSHAAFGARILRLAANSVTLSLLTAALAVAVALLLAYGARLSRSPVCEAINRMASLGYAIPGAVIAIGVLIPAARLDHAMADAAARWLGIEIGLVLTGSIVALVYAYLIRFLAVALQTVEAGLAQVTPHMEDAARSLGMNARETLARVHAPILRSSLLTAALLVFVDVMKELPATFVMRPFDFDTLAVQAWHFASDERLAEASATALAIVAAGFIPLAIAARRLVHEERQGAA